MVSASGGKKLVFAMNQNTREYLIARLHCRKDVYPIQKGRH